MSIGVDLLAGQQGLRPVEVACLVGAGGHTVATADTPIVVDHDHAVRLLPGGLYRAGLDAGWIVALHALYGQVITTGARHPGGIIVELFLSITL